MAITITQRPRETTFPDGRGRRAVVRNESGQHFLISEVHRLEVTGYRIDETLVFPCDEVGDVTNWTEVWSGNSVEDVLATFRG
jgi:hypothetical protein